MCCSIRLGQIGKEAALTQAQIIGLQNKEVHAPLSEVGAAAIPLHQGTASRKLSWPDPRFHRQPAALAHVQNRTGGNLNPVIAAMQRESASHPPDTKTGPTQQRSRIDSS